MVTLKRNISPISYKMSFLQSLKPEINDKNHIVTKLVSGDEQVCVYTALLKVSLGLLLPLLLPNLQFGLVYQLWAQHEVLVKKDKFSNSCWDTIFKAGYETGTAKYKHVYFNST